MWSLSNITGNDESLLLLEDVVDCLSERCEVVIKLEKLDLLESDAFTVANVVHVVQSGSIEASCNLEELGHGFCCEVECVL